jgi:hypothetical protein
MEGMVGSVELKMWKHLFTMVLTALQYSEEDEHYGLFAALYLLNESSFDFEFRSLSDLPSEILSGFIEESRSEVG